MTIVQTFIGSSGNYEEKPLSKVLDMMTDDWIDNEITPANVSELRDVCKQLESELAKARAIKFPRETKPDNILGGWTISFDYLMRIKKLQNTNEGPVDLETIESVLLSVELAASNTEKDGE